jgi:hypothetical protein
VLQERESGEGSPPEREGRGRRRREEEQGLVVGHIAPPLGRRRSLGVMLKRPGFPRTEPRILAPRW